MDNEQILRDCYFHSLKSLDKNTKVGCIITDEEGLVISKGFNAFVDGVHQYDCRKENPQKNHFIEHAERITIFKAFSAGKRLDGCTLYVNWFPCPECVRCIILSGIRKVVCLESEMSERFDASKDMLLEAGVDLVIVKGLGEYHAKKIS